MFKLLKIVSVAALGYVFLFFCTALYGTIFLPQAIHPGVLPVAIAVLGLFVLLTAIVFRPRKA